MYYLYVLKSSVRERHYIGITADLSAILVKHNQGGVKSTKAYRPWKLAYVENYLTKTDARKREIFLKKTARARNDIFEKINLALSSSG